MIITRTPFRITLGGGGTDLPSFYSKHRGFIFAPSIQEHPVMQIRYSLRKVEVHMRKIRML